MKGDAPAKPGTRTIVVGVSEMAISSDPAETLATYALGSCVGVTVYDPIRRVGGMIHCLLPLSGADRRQAERAPCMFVDTGFPLFLQALFDRGVRRDSAEVVVAGASTCMDEKGFFRIGERNLAILRRILWKNGILIAAEETGGRATRSVWLDMATGAVTVRTYEGDTKRESVLDVARRRGRAADKTLEGEARHGVQRPHRG